MCKKVGERYGIQRRFCNLFKMWKKNSSSARRKQNEKFKPKICAECYFYQKKIVQNIVFVIGFCFVLFGIFSFLPIPKKITFIASLVFLICGLILLIISIILKIISKFKKIEI